MADPTGKGGGLVPLSQIATVKPAEGRAGGGGGGGGRGRGQAGGPRTYAGTELTPAGDAAAAKFTQQDNPRFKCETTSIIFDWTFDGPVNRIQQNRDQILIYYGQMNLRRTIHMNTKTHPPNVKPSRAGHSIRILGRRRARRRYDELPAWLPELSDAAQRTSCTSSSASHSIRRR